GLERGLEQGLERGLEQGLERGLEQGLVQGRAAILLRQMHRRFDPLPTWVEERITTATTDELDLWSDRILDARSLEELFGR
ncbi:MAG: DUF4351 domain-containing protein, partial [Magnetococcales bacterium]|nr:DUF4351 domain-containing protein [Magnetococcales bacterium]